MLADARVGGALGRAGNRRAGVAARGRSRRPRLDRDPGGGVARARLLPRARPRGGAPRRGAPARGGRPHGGACGRDGRRFAPSPSARPPGALRQSPWLELHRADRESGGVLGRFVFNESGAFPAARPATGDVARWEGLYSGPSTLPETRRSATLAVPVRDSAGRLVGGVCARGGPAPLRHGGL